MKKIKISIVSLCLSMVMLFGFSTTVNALDETKQEQIQENKTESAKFFDKEFTKDIITFISVFVATITALCTFLKTLKSTIKSVNELIGKTSKNTENLKDENVKVLNDLKATVSKMEESMVAMQECIISSNILTQEQVQKIMEVYRLIYTNDSKLVKNGTASEIIKVLNSESETKEIAENNSEIKEEKGV